MAACPQSAIWIWKVDLRTWSYGWMVRRGVHKSNSNFNPLVLEVLALNIEKNQETAAVIDGVSL